MTEAAWGEPLEQPSIPFRPLWVPHRGMQERFLRAIEFDVFGGGAKGPGKTELLIVGATAQVHKPYYLAYITRETGPQLREIRERQHRLYPQMAERPHWNGDGHGTWRWPSGARVALEAIGTPEEAGRIQGHEPAYVGVDEAGNLKDEQTIDRIAAEIRCKDPTVRRYLRLTGNPGKAGHAWTKRRYVTPCGADGRRVVVTKVRMRIGGAWREQYVGRRFIPGTVLDNPIYANDPLYMAQLWTMPEMLRRQLLFGDYDAGMGTALDELDERVHIVRPFQVPEHWPLFAAFDWGYAHPWCFPYGTQSEDGVFYVLDTVWGRRQKPYHIAERIKHRVPVERLQYAVADSISFQKRRDRDDNTPSIAEEMQGYGIILSPATNTDRIKTLNNLRHYLAWRGIGPDGQNGWPALRFFDTPGNRKLVDQLGDMITDEDEPEDVLKVDANPETGHGGDDGYDALRTLMASRPPRPIGFFFDGDVSAFSPQTLRYMAEHIYKDGPLPGGTGRDGRHGISLYTRMTGAA